MLKVVIALMLGGIIGFSMAALVMIIPKDEEEIKRDWVEYKCKVNQASGCSDTCCQECQKFDECAMKCEGSPKLCGQSYISMR